METANESTYRANCTLHIEFFGTLESDYFLGQLRHLLAEAIRDNPWKDTKGNSLNGSLEIARAPKSTPENGADFGPTAELRFGHTGLSLPTHLVHAYDKWTNAIAGALRIKMQKMIRVKNEIKDVEEPSLSDLVLVHIQLDFTKCVKSPTQDEHIRVASKPGDIVRMSNGTLAVVTDEDYPCGGNCKVLTLRPICGLWQHLRLFWTHQLKPSDHQIDSLVKVGEVPLT